MSSFYETIFIKKETSMEAKLSKMKENPRVNLDRVIMLEAGIAGEKQVEYHLKKSSVGMYAMRDINLAYEDLKAQIDFVLVTSHHCYFIECKNYNADIIHVDQFGNFEISTRYGKKYNKLGIKSPISQVEDQLTVFKKICLNNQEKVKELLGSKKFNDYFKTMVVFTNPENRINITNAPSDIKYRILKVDNLIRQIEYDERHYKGDYFSKEQMLNIANFILNNNKEIELELIPEIDYFKNKNDNDTKHIEYDKSNSKKTIRQSNKKDTLLSKIMSGLKKFLIFIVVWAFFATIVDYYNQNTNVNQSNNGSQVKIDTLSEYQLKAIDIFKSAYEDSKNNGFTIIHTSVCYEVSKIFNNGTVCTSCCNSLPIEFNYISDNKMTFYKESTNSCSTLEIDDDGKKIKNVISEKKVCHGQPIGMVEWDDDNQFYQKIGGYDKIRKMAIEVYNNKKVFDASFFVQSHIEERGGNIYNFSSYAQNINMYFAGITGVNYIKSNTTKDYFNKMVESYYYLMEE